MQQQVGLAGFLERRLERRDQGVRQVADEADRVGQERVPAAAEPPAPGARVERREQLVLDQTPASVSAFISVLLPALV